MYSQYAETETKNSLKYIVEDYNLIHIFLKTFIYLSYLFYLLVGMNEGILDERHVVYIRQQRVLKIDY